jgi:hypothetical protein
MGLLATILFACFKLSAAQAEQPASDCVNVSSAQQVIEQITQLGAGPGVANVCITSAECVP